MPVSLEKEKIYHSVKSMRSGDLNQRA